MDIIFLIVGVIIGAVALYATMKPKLKTFQKYDTETLQKNAELKEQYETLLIQRDEASAEKKKMTDEYIELVNQCKIQEAKRSEILIGMKELQQQSVELAEQLYSQSYEMAATNMEHAAERLSRDFDTARIIMEEEYQKTTQECCLQFQKEIEEKQKELEKVEATLQDYINKLNAAVEAYKRAEELKEKENFYKLNLTPEDIAEIEKLREVVPHLRQAEALNKVIWKVYYEKPYTDLIGRVVGTGTHTGIYKITNTLNQKCYIGQAANIADRWKQHIKRGIGAETATRNKLYPAMMKHGVENFTFEIVEECDRNLLNEREDYWQEFFHAKDFGYSIK